MIELHLTDANIKEFEQKTRDEMTQAIKHFERELITIRTGRAHPGLVEDIQVICYGNTTMRIKEVGSIATPESRLIVITPWDKNVLNDIEKAIMQSDLGVSPVNDGTLIRITLPEMSSQRRDELKKILLKKLEDCRISIRNVRKDMHNLIRDALKEKSISEDHSHRLNDALQKITDDFGQKCENMANNKEREITSF